MLVFLSLVVLADIPDIVTTKWGDPVWVSLDYLYETSASTKAVDLFAWLPENQQRSLHNLMSNARLNKQPETEPCAGTLHRVDEEMHEGEYTGEFASDRWLFYLRSHATILMGRYSNQVNGLFEGSPAAIARVDELEILQKGRFLPSDDHLLVLRHHAEIHIEDVTICSRDKYRYVPVDGARVIVILSRREYFDVPVYRLRPENLIMEGATGAPLFNSMLGFDPDIRGFSFEDLISSARAHVRDERGEVLK